MKTCRDDPRGPHVLCSRYYTGPLLIDDLNVMKSDPFGTMSWEYLIGMADIAHTAGHEDFAVIDIAWALLRDGARTLNVSLS